jgi:uncharacterized membrane protein (DUF4010 family)
MDVATAFQTVGISLGLGLLVGFQRERTHALLAGVRTFALITVLGTITGMLALELGPWLVAAGFLAVAITAAIGNVMLLREEERADPGITTEIAILLMYGIGCYLVFGSRPVAVVLSGAVALLLYAKPVMHGFVQRLGENDVRAVMQFVLITLVILPVLPDRTLGPFEALNPREVWWMVVLVVTISLLGYIAFKLCGPRAGTVLAGLIGGLVSSTATTVSATRRAAVSSEPPAAAVLIVVLASTVVYVRVLIEIFVAAGRSAILVAPPIAILLLIAIFLSAALAWRNRGARADTPAPGNPTELKTALVFGATYAVVLLAVAAAGRSFGDQGVYVAAGFSGLTDMDAITLTTSRMTATGSLQAGVASRAILIACIANLVFKSLLVLMLGGVMLARRLAIPFAIQIVAAIVLVWIGSG